MLVNIRNPETGELTTYDLPHLPPVGAYVLFKGQTHRVKRLTFPITHDRTNTTPVVEVGEAEPFTKPAVNPIHQDDDGWWFWQETWADREGPFDTKHEAEDAFAFYCRTVLASSPSPDSPQSIADKIEAAVLSERLACVQALWSELEKIPQESSVVRSTIALCINSLGSRVQRKS